MSSETITVQARDAVGSNAMKRLRSAGQVPAVLYGHGEDNVHLSIQTDVIANVIKQGAKLLSLTGAVTDTAVLRQVQWDTYGAQVLHVDLFRVSKSESVEVNLPIHLHGESPGTSEGGQVIHQAHELTILCPVTKIPEYLEVPIGGLHLGDSITAEQVALPQGASLVSSPTEVIVQVITPVDESLEEEVEGGEEPELIGKEKEEEE